MAGTLSQVAGDFFARRARIQNKESFLLSASTFLRHPALAQAAKI
jgi:hypothetical protein